MFSAYTIVAIALLSLASILGGCRTRDEAGSATLEASGASVKAILDDKCASCHSDESLGWAGVNYIGSLDALITNGKVVRGTPEQQQNSPLLLRIISTDRPMPPPTPPMAPADSKAVQDWILADSPLADAAGAPHPLATAARVALEAYCSPCHTSSAPGTGEGNINYITDLAKLVEKGKVKRGADEAARKKSRIFVRITSANSPMPPVVAPLQPAEVETIRQWVMAGAPL